MKKGLKAETFIRDMTTKVKQDKTFTSCDFDKYMDLIIKQCCIEIPAGRKYYRARIYTEEDRYDKWHSTDYCDTTFYGYDKKSSFVNLTSQAGNGRCNKKGEIILYMATDAVTAIQEVCNKPNIAVNVSEIKLLENVKIVDFAMNGVITSGTVDLDYDVEFLNEFMFGLVQVFNKSALCDDDYCMTQYVSNYIKRKGLDGLQYLSSYNRLGDMESYDKVQNEKGIDLAIFNHTKAESCNSDLFLIADAKIRIEPFNK